MMTRKMREGKYPPGRGGEFRGSSTWVRVVVQGEGIILQKKMS